MKRPWSEPGLHQRSDWTVPRVLEQIGWPLGRRNRTTCPITRGDNDQAFHYQEERWYCFSCNEGGGVPRLLERLGFPERAPTTPGIPRVPQGTEFVVPTGQGWLRERSRRPVFRATLGQVSAVLERKREAIAEAVRWAWEAEHGTALRLYRSAQDKGHRLHALEPEHPDLDFVFAVMAECVSRLQEAHRPLQPPCPGDCWVEDDPRPVENRVDKAQCVSVKA